MSVGRPGCSPLNYIYGPVELTVAYQLDVVCADRAEWTHASMGEYDILFFASQCRFRLNSNSFHLPSDILCSRVSWSMAEAE